MHTNVVFFPGRTCVVFRKGPCGFPLQEPSHEARQIKNNPTLQEKSAPLKEELGRTLSLWCVREEEMPQTGRRCWETTSFNLESTKGNPLGGFWRMM